MIAVTYGGATSSAGDYFGYDDGGRNIVKVQQTGGVNYRLTAGLNVSGGFNTITYPSGRSVNYAYDSAGRISAVTGNLADGPTRNYSTEIIYSSLGGMTKEKFGTTTAVYNKLFYNSRGQLSEIRDSTSWTDATDTTWNRGAIINHYSDQCSGMCGGSNSATPMTDNNGNVRKQEVFIPNDDQISGYTLRWQQYDYDSLNRLNWAREVKGGVEQWRQWFKYDRWGNRTIDFTQDPGDPHLRTYGINSSQFKIDPQTNQLFAPNDQFLPNAQTNNLMQYDQAGNLKNDLYTGTGNRTYDAENRITSAWGGNNQAQLYAYDASGQRIKRTVDGLQTFQVFGFGGELVAEYPAMPTLGSPQKEYAYRNGQLLITAEPGAAVAPTTGLIAYWKLDENSGATTADSSGNGHTGTLTNGPTWTTGQVNAGVSFDGVNDQIVNNGIADVTNNFTISFWAQPTATHQIDTESTSGVGGTAGQRYAIWPLWHNNGHAGAGISVGTNGVSVYEHADSYMPATLVYSGSLSGWTHVTVVYENRQPKLYINGTLVRTGLTSPMSFVNINPLEIGGDVYGYYAGKLDDVRVYNRALSAAEVATLPNGSSASGAQLKWLVTDQLGTPRMVLDQSGALTNVKRHDYLPFGEELLAPTGGRTTGQGYAGDGVRQQFTEKERDVETGLDYFLARYYSAPQGRFVSVDPLAASAHASRPQTWNRYSYVLNNPLRHTDPTGMTVAEYDQMSQAAIEQRRWFHAAKQSEQPADTSATPAQQPPNTLDLRQDPNIVSAVREITENAAPLKKDEKPVLTSVAIVPGQISNIANTKLIDAYGNVGQPLPERFNQLQ